MYVGKGLLVELTIAGKSSNSRAQAASRVTVTKREVRGTTKKGRGN